MVVLVFVSILMMGSTFEETPQQPLTNIQPAKKQACTGFTVIEASKGIDCHGDTVRLVKRGGIYEMLRPSKPGDGGASTVLANRPDNYRGDNEGVLL